jgi:hypothetical protein
MGYAPRSGGAIALIAADGTKLSATLAIATRADGRDEGTWRWQVSCTGDPNNVPVTSACGVEHFTVTNN